MSRELPLFTLMKQAHVLSKLSPPSEQLKSRHEGVELAAIRNALEQAKRGEGRPAEEVFDELERDASNEDYLPGF